MSIHRRIEAIESALEREYDEDGRIESQYSSWQPWESPPTIPTGVRLTPATEQARAELLAIDESIPFCE